MKSGSLLRTSALTLPGGTLAVQLPLGPVLACTTSVPLVTVTVATRDRPELLASRSLPSILGQSYGELEVIVVGDDADVSTEGVIRGFADSRVISVRCTKTTRSSCRAGCIHHVNDAFGRV